MFVYNNNHHQSHKTSAKSHRRDSSNRTAKGKTSTPKRKSLPKQGKSLHKANVQFLRTLGLVVRKRQK